MHSAPPAAAPEPQPTQSPASPSPAPAESVAGDALDMIGLPDGAQATVESVAAWHARWPDREKLLTECQEMDSILAAVLLLVGLAYGSFGYTIFRLATIINCAALGAWAGWWLGGHFEARLPGMLLGAVLAAAIAWPAMRFMVAGCGGIIGFVLGVAIWRSLGLQDTYAAAGGMIGAVFLFMLSFILFKLSIIVFTSVQGVVMLLAGLLGLLMKYPELDQSIVHYTGEYRVVLPIVLLSLSVVAAIFQQSWHRGGEAGKQP